jgi:hypothetical protein
LDCWCLQRHPTAFGDSVFHNYTHCDMFHHDDTT